MDYSHIYNQLIERGQIRQIGHNKKSLVALIGYVERHHIIPRSMNGSNKSDNLVYLTPEEHFVAHGLLVKLHPGELGPLRALMILSGPQKNRNNKLYGWARRRYSEMRKGIPPSNKGVKREGPAWNKGIKMSAETRAKQSEKKKRQVSIEGIVYNSLREAAVAQGFGTNYNRVTNRCNSDLHPEWFFLGDPLPKRKSKIGKSKGPMSEDAKAKISKENSGNIPWNKDKKTGIKTAGCFPKGNVPWNTGKTDLVAWNKGLKKADYPIKQPR